jgi:peptidylprolyl isomerase
MSDPEPGKEETKEESPHVISAPVAENAAAAATPDGLTEGSLAETAGAARNHKKTFMAIGAAVVIIAAVLGAYILITMPTAMTGDTVAIYYNESFENGTVYLSAMNTTYPPLVFIIGNSSVISGIQDAVIGMSPGETKTVTIPYTLAYGAYDPGLVQTVNRTGPVAQMIFGNMTLKPGQYTVRYRTTTSTLTILNVTNTTLTVDTNNPLAGYNLTFTIQLANLTRASTAEAAA